MAGLSLSGIASGVDTASIVDQLMALERQSLTKYGYRKAAATGQQDALKEVASKLSTLKDAALALSADSTWAQKQTVESSDPTRVAVAMLAGAGIGGQSISVDRLASSAQRRFDFAPAAFDGDGKTTGAGTLRLHYGTLGSPTGNDVTINIEAGWTKQQIADAVNAKATGPAVAAVVKDGAGVEQLVLSARKTGKDSDFAFETTGGIMSEDGTFTRVTGDDLQAAYRIGSGAQQLSSSNIVENAIAGVRLTFKGVTTAPATVNVTEPALDRDAIKSKIKSFIDAYNAVVDTTRSKLTEARVRNPTSDFQAARGSLFGDSGMTSMLSRLRQDMAEVLPATAETQFNDLGDIGIAIPRATGTSSADAKAGKLVLDEAKLTAALDTDFTKVKDFLTTFSKDVETFVKAQTGGTGIIDDRIKSGDRQSKRIQDQIDRATERLDAREKRLKAQFAAMEVALQNSQTQGAWLSGQIAGLSANKS
jgi:flagellar hook-associated protein 2